MFEKAIVRGGSPRGLSFPVALALHGLAIGAIVGSSVWFVGEPSEPPIPVTFPQIPRAATGTSAAGPEKSGGSSRRPMASSPRRLPAPVATVADSVQRNESPATDESLADLPEEGPSVDGGFLGDGSGEQPGDGGRPRQPGRGGDIVRVGGAVREPEILRRVDPQYPEAARKARIEGDVILDAVIATSGEVEEVRVIHSAGRLLDDAAADALRRWIYRPAKLNGREVRVLLTVTVSFRIH